MNVQLDMGLRTCIIPVEPHFFMQSLHIIDVGFTSITESESTQHILNSISSTTH